MHLFSGAFQFPVFRMHALVPTDTATAVDYDDDSFALIGRKPPQPKFQRFGIDLIGRLYEYGDTPGLPQRVLTYEDTLNFCAIHDLALIQRGGDRSKTYLDLTINSPDPYTIFVLSLPCFNSGADRPSWPVRSLLGSLAEADKLLDLRAMTGKIGSRRGTKANAQGHKANFIVLYLDDGSLLKAPSLEPDRHTLEVTVERLRRSLAFSPQF